MQALRHACLTLALSITSEGVLLPSVHRPWPHARALASQEGSSHFVCRQLAWIYCCCDTSLIGSGLAMACFCFLMSGHFMILRVDLTVPNPRQTAPASLSAPSSAACCCSGVPFQGAFGARTSHLTHVLMATHAWQLMLPCIA